MGCGDSKVILFEGTPDEEVKHYAGSIMLAARSGEGGKGPFKRVELGLTQILKAVQVDEAKISPLAADRLAEAIECLRIDANKIFEKKLNDINVVRIACSLKISYAGDVGMESAEDVPQQKVRNNYAKLSWIPRVVAIEETDVNTLGSTYEVGLCGPSARALGFCVEAWVLDNSPMKKGDWNSSMKLVDCTSGDGRVNGATPHCYIDKAGRIVFDFHKTAFNSGKISIQEGQWNHVAYVYSRGQIKLYVNARLISLKNSSIDFPDGHAALTLCTGGTGFVTEMRIWNSERTDEQITSNMKKSISPSQAKDFPSLRMCWLPLAKDGFNNPKGSLLFDTWTRKPVGTRGGYPQISDSRWSCALPSLLMPVDNLFQLNHEDESREEWEHQQLTAVAAQNFSRYHPTPSAVEERGLQVVNLLMQKGGPWVPRVVSLPPGTTALIGTTAGLGLKEPAGFTIECWFRLRGAIDANVENTILGVGFAEATGDRVGLTISLKGGRPCFGFTGHEIESEAGIATLRWTHLACMYDGVGMLKMYANGNLISHGECEPLQGNCCLTIGTNRNKNPLMGDLCEFRVWNRPLEVDELNQMKNIAIPPLGGRAFHNLRLVWLPLRTGGPWSREFWCRRQTVRQGLIKGCPEKDAQSISRPFPTLLWDVTNARDVGNLNDHSCLLTSRTRNMQIPVFIPPVNELPPAWSKSAAAIIDEWSDCLDRAFVPKWYVPPMLDSEHVDESLSSFPTSAAEAAVKGGPWVPRVMRPVLGTSYSTIFGKTQEAGLLGVGTGGREFTVELWMRPRRFIAPKSSSKKKKDNIVYEDLLGHEDAKSNESTGFFGTGKPFALRLGLADGRPFICLQGALSSLRQKDTKECVISTDPLEIDKWFHVAYVIQGDGKMFIYIDGVEVAKAERIGPLQAKGDTNVHIFGYEERKWQTEICELRMWGTGRKQKDIEETMLKSFAPQPTGHPQEKGLRFSWFPCNSARSIVWDHKYINFRGVYSRDDQIQYPHWTRRPEFLPPKLKAQIKSVPCCYLLDDIGDSYERNHAPGIVPPVLRDDWGQIAYDKFDSIFQPLKKKTESGGGFSSMTMNDEREVLDVGWQDADDGTFTQKNAYILDDGGYHMGWGNVKEEVIEEIHVDKQDSLDSVHESYIEVKEDVHSHHDYSSHHEYSSHHDQSYNDGSQHNEYTEHTTGHEHQEYIEHPEQQEYHPEQEELTVQQESVGESHVVETIEQPVVESQVEETPGSEEVKSEEQ